MWIMNGHKLLFTFVGGSLKAFNILKGYMALSPEYQEIPHILSARHIERRLHHKEKNIPRTLQQDQHIIAAAIFL